MTRRKSIGLDIGFHDNHPDDLPEPDEMKGYAGVLACRIGVEKALDVVHLFRGKTVCFDDGLPWLIELRDVRLKRDFKAGFNISDLAKKYNLCVPRVLEIVEVSTGVDARILC